MDRRIESALNNFKSCAENAPEGTYEEAKKLNDVIGNAVDDLMGAIKDLGLKADNCDRAFELEAAIYDYVKRSNPESTIFPVSEGFGSSMDTPARERVIAQAESNRDFLRSIGSSKPQ